ncbi:hypothetical protein [uncultured Oscillibacter sp.]|uniref:hypothetical protein n=1 Tax=uncultured Oscillibacter sp. TaxID=876091 RepID=UPI0025E0F4F0|nr:hypothetical protein [uncultured Oscillibacter sp.]
MTQNNLANALAAESGPIPAPKPVSPRERRVGTFTFGVTLVAAGLAMTAALFYPALDLRVFLRFSPLVLILLGTEVLLSSRKEGRIKYDWLGMLLSFFLVLLALGVFFASWAMLHFQDEIIHW